MTRYISVGMALTAMPWLLALDKRAEAHCFAGERFFPATIATDDPTMTKPLLGG